jgi:hypothetical protein
MGLKPSDSPLRLGLAHHQNQTWLHCLMRSGKEQGPDWPHGQCFVNVLGLPCGMRELLYPVQLIVYQKCG